VAHARACRGDRGAPSPDPIARTRARVLAACLDAGPSRLDTGTIPPPWHWACFVPTVPTAALGPERVHRGRAPGWPSLKSEITEYRSCQPKQIRF
jgi:hypothetical protein